MQHLVQEAAALQDELVAWRRHLHANPEVGMEIPNTAAFVKEKLESMGYEAGYIAGTGVTALAGGKKPGKVMLLRADMDALPVTEETDLEFRSTNGKMHACGHDFHTAMLLGAAKILKAHEDEIDGTVKFMFQPAEETLEGAKAMVESGILDNPKVDAAAMFHVMAGGAFPSGTVVVPPGGPFSAASDWMEITFQGKGGHGAMPENTVDPLFTMVQAYQALLSIKTRELAASDEAVMTIGSMHGGEAHNVIPDTAFMKGTIRTYDPKVREYVQERIPAIMQGVAETHRATVDAKIIKGCPSTINDGKVADDVRESLQEAFGAKCPGPDVMGGKKMSGSEDFSFVAEKVPAVMMMLSAGSPGEGYKFPMHHPKATFNEEILSQGAAAYAVTAMGWLSKNK